MKTGHDNFVDLIMATTDSFTIEFRWNTNPTIHLQRYLGIAGASFSYQPANAQYVEVDFQGLGPYYKVYLQSYDGSDTLAKTIKLTWHKTDSTLRTYRNDTLKHTSTGVVLKSTALASGTASLVLNNTGQGTSDGTYDTQVLNFSGNSTWHWIKFMKNDTTYLWDMNAGSELFVHPRVFVGGLEIFPYKTYSYLDRPANTNAILLNGATSNIDTLEGTFFFGDLKADYRDCFIANAEISSWIGTPYNIHSEGFGGESLVIGDSLYVCGNFNIANGTSKTRVGYDSAKSVVKYDPATAKWVQLGYGMTTVTGTSGCMHIGAYGDSIIATGYDRTATGVGTINGVAIRRAGQSNWSAMGLGLGVTGVGFGGGEGYGKYLLGGSFTKAGGAYGNFIQSWNGVSWDSCRGGLDDVPYVMKAYVWNGENGWLVGGAFLNFVQGGVATPCSGLAFWSNDSLKWKKFYDMQTTGHPNNVVFNILIDGNWIYYVGSFVGMGTATSRGICRYQIGVGAQNVGTGLKSVVNAEAITSISKIGNIIYIAGSFIWFNDFLSRNLAGFNVVTGYVKDMGYGMNMRPEGTCKYYNSSIASDTILVIAGDNLTANGKRQRIVSLYNPTLNP